jgi:hypothetical protein
VFRIRTNKVQANYPDRKSAKNLKTEPFQVAAQLNTEYQNTIVLVGNDLNEDLNPDPAIFLNADLDPGAT